MGNIERRLRLIEERNKKVELDKAWETSLSRRVIVAILTYIIVVLFFIFASLPRPFINSIVPAAAFILSNMSLPYFKVLWTRNKAKKIMTIRKIK